MLSAIDILRNAGMNIPEVAVKEGLFAARWAARFEIISKNPLIIFDGAHNPQGICSAVESIHRYFDQKVYVLTGVLRDKDYKFISKKLSEIAERAFTMTPDNKRALSAEEYAKTLSDEGVLARPCPDIKSAFETARAAA